MATGAKQAPPAEDTNSPEGGSPSSGGGSYIVTTDALVTGSGKKARRYKRGDKVSLDADATELFLRLGAIKAENDDKTAARTSAADLAEASQVDADEVPGDKVDTGEGNEQKSADPS